MQVVNGNEERVLGMLKEFGFCENSFETTGGNNISLRN